MTRRFTKSVDTVVKDDDERVAVGAVLVPNRVDHQGDFERADSIRDAYGDAYDHGVLHAAFPEGHAETEYRLLESAETIGDREYPAGTLLAERTYHDDQLWQFVKSGVLGGFSIGGRVHESQDHPGNPDNLPDGVEYDEGAGPFETVTELKDLTIEEVSDVDLPAVPSASFAAVKSVAGVDGEIGKNLLEMAGSPEEFADLIQSRNSDVNREDAWALYEYMQSVGKAKQSLDSEVKDCKDSVLEDNPEMSESEAIAICRDQLGKCANDAGGNSGVETTNDYAMSNTDTEDAPADKSLEDVDNETLGARIKSALGLGSGDENTGANIAETPEEDPRGNSRQKGGRTLSKRNVALVKEMHDDAEMLLQDAGVDGHSRTARTYHEDKYDDYERGDHHAYDEYEDKAADLEKNYSIDEVAGVVLGGGTRDAVLDGLAGLDAIEGIDDNRAEASGVVDSVLESRVDALEDDDHEAAREDYDDEDEEHESADETKAAESAADLFDDVDPDQVDSVVDKVENIAN